MLTSIAALLFLIGLVAVLTGREALHVVCIGVAVNIGLRGVLPALRSA